MDAPSLPFNFAGWLVIIYSCSRRETVQHNSPDDLLSLRLSYQLSQVFQTVFILEVHNH